MFYVFVSDPQTEVSSVLFWSSDSRQMALTVTLCVLASAVLLAAVVLFLVRRRYQAHQKLKDLTQSVEGEVTRDYQVVDFSSPNPFIVSLPLLIV